MKKISLISIIVFIAMTLFCSFTLNKTSDDKNLEDNNLATTIVIVRNCDDCSDVYVCVNGTTSYNFKSCTFYVDCDPNGPQIQTICVKCGDKTGTSTVDCVNLPRAVIVTVENSGEACDCLQTKKKK